MGYDVFGMCNPLYDIQAEVADSLLDDLDLQKGGMFLIDAEQQRKLVSGIYESIVNAEPGGSGANTMFGIALLGGVACYTGKVADDEYGQLYVAGLQKRAVDYFAPLGPGETGISVILITPDKQRTMCTFLGQARTLAPGDVYLDALNSSKYLYVTGYLWDTETQKEAVLHAMRAARKAGVKVAFSLSDPFCVDRHKQVFLQIIHEYVDLLFGNEEEAQALTDTNSPLEAIRALAPFCEMAAVTAGKNGSLLRRQNTVVNIPCYPVEAVDTTGAGDMYAAGLLYGLTHDLPLEKAGRVAAYTAAMVVGKLGPRLESLDTAEVLRDSN